MILVLVVSAFIDIILLYMYFKSWFIHEELMY